jgi:hypothetical protein
MDPGWVASCSLFKLCNQDDWGLAHRRIQKSLTDGSIFGIYRNPILTKPSQSPKDSLPPSEAVKMPRPRIRDCPGVAINGRTTRAASFVRIPETVWPQALSEIGKD